MTKINEIKVGSYVTWAANGTYYNDFNQLVESVNDSSHIKDKNDIRYIYMGKVVDVGLKYVYVVNDRQFGDQRILALSQEDINNIHFEVTEPAKDHSFPEICGCIVKMPFEFKKIEDNKYESNTKYNNEPEIYRFVEKGMRFYWFCGEYEECDDKENILVPFYKMFNKSLF